MYPFLPGYNLPFPPIFLVVLAIWSAAWSGMALWRAARSNQLYWFVFFLFVHTAGILEFIYLQFFAKKKNK